MGIVQIAPTDAVRIGQRVLDHAALIEILPCVGPKGGQHLGPAGCVVVAGIQGILHDGHCEVQRHGAVVVRGRSRLAGGLLHHDIGVGGKLHRHIIGSGLLIGAGLFLRPAVFDRLGSGKADPDAKLAVQRRDLIAQIDALLKAIGFAAVDLAGGCRGGGVRDLLLGADLCVGHVFHAGGVGGTVRRILDFGRLIEFAAILRQDRGDGKIAEQYAQRLIVALFIGAAGLVRTGHHPVDVALLGVVPQRLIFPDGAITGIITILVISAAAGTPIPGEHLIFHGICRRGHGVRVDKSAGADIIAVVSIGSIGGISAGAASIIGQSVGNHVVELGFEFPGACASALDILDAVGQILPQRCRGLSVQYFVFRGQHILDKQPGAVIKVFAVRSEICNAIDGVLLSNGSGRIVFPGLLLLIRIADGASICVEIVVLVCSIRQIAAFRAVQTAVGIGTACYAMGKCRTVICHGAAIGGAAEAAGCQMALNLPADEAGIDRKCRCGQQAQYHNESKQAAEYSFFHGVPPFLHDSLLESLTH